jgi:hypothetical protein
LLIIALLLWPLDIALRRVSIGRRELADARRAVGAWRHRRAPAARPVEVAGMLTARERAAGASSRAALLRPSADTSAAATTAASTAARPPRERPATTAPVPAAPVPPPSPTSKPAAAPESAPQGDGDTLARLREAKRRARGS